MHFGISDVFQRFLGHLEPLNQNPSDAVVNRQARGYLNN